MSEPAPRVFGVYVPKSGHTNFHVGQRKGVWGAKAAGRLADARPGDRILFVCGLTMMHDDVRGYPRVPTARDFEGYADEVAWGTVTSPQYESEATVWGDDIYPYRLDVAFEDSQRNVDFTVDAFGVTVVDAVRQSATSSGRLYRADGAKAPPRTPSPPAIPHPPPTPPPPRAPDTAPPASLAEAVHGFANDLWGSHIRFGPRPAHDAFVRGFMASAAVRRFVILTGLSGSGKTQIALQFGRWLGHYQVIPVRPDWTGAEALFGFDNALRQTPDGRSTYDVPDALAFMLHASRAPGAGHVLVLDEMNLAHVERYFADLLSGMESAEVCLPAPERLADGLWVRGSSNGRPSSVAVPSNLFIVGTVNVDETTYMFSPKVLDRAQTIEFRVPTEALPSTIDGAQMPGSVGPGAARLVDAFLRVATEPTGHMEQAAALPYAHELVAHLRTVHSLLAEHDFEFGHRLFQEAVRFAVIWAAAGGPADEPVDLVLDRIVLQKMLPRLHGSMRRLERPLAQLAQFAFMLTVSDKAFDALAADGTSARLPMSFDKIRRMMRKLEANHFTSFSE